MQKFNLTAFLLGAVLFIGVGVTSVNAEDGKCGTAKCGSSESVKTASKCGAEKKEAMTSEKCGVEQKEAMKSEKSNNSNGDAKSVTKCGGNK